MTVEETLKSIEEDEYKYCAGCDFAILPGEDHEECAECLGPLCRVCANIYLLCPDCEGDRERMDNSFV